jgi:hypothetical protein
MLTVLTQTPPFSSGMASPLMNKGLSDRHFISSYRLPTIVRPVSDHEPLLTTIPAAAGRWSKSRTIAQCFPRLSSLDPTFA